MNMNELYKHRLLLLLKIAVVFIGIIIFPIGLFLLGYVIGQSRERKTKKEMVRTETVIDSKESSEEKSEENEVLVV